MRAGQGKAGSCAIDGMLLMMVQLAFNNTAGTAPGKRRRCHKLLNKSLSQQPADEDDTEGVSVDPYACHQAGCR
jgi:hypothetical protein